MHACLGPRASATFARGSGLLDMLFVHACHAVLSLFICVTAQAVCLLAGLEATQKGLA